MFHESGSPKKAGAGRLRLRNTASNIFRSRQSANSR